MTILITLFLIACPALATNITDCTTITSSGTYNLTENITSSTNGACIHIQASSVKIYCNGHSITGTKASGSIGILASRNYPKLYNCTVSNWETGLKLEGSNSGDIFDSTFSGNEVGVFFEYAEGNEVLDSKIEKNGVGLRLSFSGTNKFSNNLFNNSVNVNIDGTSKNIWNATLTEKERIFSEGTYTGGNYWTSPSGGYSYSCADSNKDGFCDEAYELDSDNVDYLPLSDEYVPDTIPPTIEIISPKSGDIISNTSIRVTVSADDLVYHYTNISLIRGNTIINSVKAYTNGTFSRDLWYGNGGYYNITATAYDLEGNSANATVTNILTPLGISSCTDIDLPGETYFLKNKLSYNGGSVCINIKADDITLDCRGYSIQGKSTGYTLYGIALNGRENVTITNCTIEDWDYGLLLHSARENTITDSKIQDNREAGIYLYSSKDNQIYNNYFDNSDNIAFDGEYLENYWNLEDTEKGDRIYSSGKYLGGNYWTGPSDGYSDYCKDSNEDGICDNEYDLAEDEENEEEDVNVDEYPLSDEYVPDTTDPVTTATAELPNGSEYSFNTWTTADYVKITLKCSDNSRVSNDDECTFRIYVEDEAGDDLSAKIYVDGDYKATDDYISVEVDEGDHTIKATKSGYDSDSEGVECRDGDTETVYLELDEEGSSSEDDCTLKIYVEDEDSDDLSANIYIDGDYEDYDDYLEIEVDEGSHTVKATKSGYDSDSESVTCSNGETETVYLTLDEDSGDDECTLKIYVEDGDGDDLKANIYIDGDYEDYDDYIEIEVDEGDHTVKATKSGYDSNSETITCEDGDTETVYLELDDDEDADTGCDRTYYKITRESDGKTIDEGKYYRAITLDFDKDETDTYNLTFYSIDDDGNEESTKKTKIKSASSTQKMTVSGISSNSFTNKSLIPLEIDILHPEEMNQIKIELLNSTKGVLKTITTKDNSTSKINITLSADGNYSILATFNSTSGFAELHNISGIYRDTLPPEITSFKLSPSTVFLGESIYSSCSASDDVAGIISGKVTGVTTNTVGTRTATCTATDDAGNSVKQTTEYNVEIFTCSDNQKRCSGKTLQICEDNEWTVLEDCDYLCDADLLRCIDKSSEETETPPDTNETANNEEENDPGESFIDTTDPGLIMAGVVLIVIIVGAMGVIYMKLFQKPKKNLYRKMAVLENKVREAERKGKNTKEIRKELALAEQDLNVGLFEMAEPRMKDIEKKLKKL